MGEASSCWRSSQSVDMARVAISDKLSRTKDLPNQYSQNISSIAILPASSDSSTSTTSIKYDTIMRRAAILHMVQA